MRVTASTLATLVAVLSLASPFFALGINCRGGAGCPIAHGGAAQELTDHVSHIDQDRHYDTGELIACITFGVIFSYHSHICAFIQKRDGGASGGDILRLAHYIPEHGCRKCGSVPYNFPGVNNVDLGGELTFNFVSSGACRDGLCGESVEGSKEKA